MMIVMLVLQLLQREYEGYIVPPESSYDFSVEFDYSNLPEDRGEYAKEVWLGGGAEKL